MVDRAVEHRRRRNRRRRQPRRRRSAREHRCSVRPRSALEFSGTFGGEGFQHVGLGVDYNDVPWAMSSTAAARFPSRLHARTSGTSTAITDASPTVRHTYADRVEAQPRPSTPSTVSRKHRRHGCRDGRAAGRSPPTSTAAATTVSVDWLRLSPVTRRRAVSSRRAFDADSTVGWQTLAWQAQTPQGTQRIAAERPAGRHRARPTRTWSAWKPVAGLGRHHRPGSAATPSTDGSARDDHRLRTEPRSSSRRRRHDRRATPVNRGVHRDRRQLHIHRRRHADGRRPRRAGQRQRRGRRHAHGGGRQRPGARHARRSTPTARSPTRPPPTTTASTSFTYRANDGTPTRTRRRYDHRHAGQRRAGRGRRQLHGDRRHAADRRRPGVLGQRHRRRRRPADGPSSADRRTAR